MKSRLSSTPELNEAFVFPYSTDKLKRRDEVWGNLQNGLLLEDKNLLVPWQTPFNQLGKYKEKRRDSGDRTEWYLGKHKILDGYECHLEVMMWMGLPWTNPITSISEKLGTDFQGNKKFLELKEKITDLLGEPTQVDLGKFGSFYLGVIEWINGRATISLVGIEHFNCRYSMNIGLVEDKNRKYMNEKIEKTIERLKAQGLTEEELGK